jgi:hypothetical protein
MAVTAQDSSDVGHLRARVAELELQLEARTQTVVTLAQRIRELEGADTSALVQRAHAAQHELDQLRSTKLVRLAAGPRRLYAAMRRWVRA